MPSSVASKRMPSSIGCVSVDAVRAGDLQRDDLVLELAGLRRGDGALVAVEGVFVEFVLRQAVFFRHHFRAGELAELDVRIALFHARALVGAEAVLGRRGCEARPIGTRVMLSTPAAITMSIVPDITAWAAKCSACCDEPHWRSIEVPGTLSGSFDARMALRATLTACSPRLHDAAHDDVLDLRRDRRRCARPAHPARRRRDRPDASRRGGLPCGRLRCVRRRRYRPRP